MKTKEVNGVCLVDIEANDISAEDVIALNNLYEKKGLKKRIGIDLKYIETIKHDFWDFLISVANKGKVSLYNVPNDVYLMLFISKYDAYVDMYLNEMDFISSKNSIVYRRLKLLKSA